MSNFKKMILSEGYLENEELMKRSKVIGVQFAKEIETMMKNILPDSPFKVIYDDNLLCGITIYFAARPYQVTIHNDPYWINVHIYGRDKYIFDEPYSIDYSGGNRKVPFRRAKAISKSKVMATLNVYFTKIKEAMKAD